MVRPPAAWHDQRVEFRIPHSLQRLAIEVEGWIDLGDTDRALDKLGPLLEHPGARPAGLALMVRALVDRGEYARALEVLGEIRRLPHDPEWLAVTEGWCRRRNEDLPGAIRCMERLIATSRHSAIGHFNLACYLALCGRDRESLAMLAHAIALDEAFRALARDETDFESLRNDSRFRTLVDPIR